MNQDLNALLQDLLARWEGEVVEFKRAENDFKTSGHEVRRVGNQLRKNLMTERKESDFSAAYWQSIA